MVVKFAFDSQSFDVNTAGRRITRTETDVLSTFYGPEYTKDFCERRQKKERASTPAPPLGATPWGMTMDQVTKMLHVLIPAIKESFKKQFDELQKQITSVKQDVRVSLKFRGAWAEGMCVEKYDCVTESGRLFVATKQKWEAPSPAASRDLWMCAAGSSDQHADRIAELERTFQDVGAEGDEIIRRLDALEGRDVGVNYAGTFVTDHPYERGQLVTRNGGLWLALKNTQDVPGSNGQAWRLVCKEGHAR